jgi:serine/threonine protein phosphatase PrpC
VLLSQDHKPTREDESKRIRDAGGFVINNRVMGELAVSRAFGDVDFKKGIQVSIGFFI